jgi:hypothetical protein
MGRFVDMMVMDGCFLLEWARTAGIVIDGNVAVDSVTNDPTFSVRSYIKLWATTKRDMIAMENQLPLVVLQRLVAVQSGKFPRRTFLPMYLEPTYISLSQPLYKASSKIHGLLAYSLRQMYSEMA